MYPLSRADKNFRPLTYTVGYPESTGVRPELEKAASFLAYCQKVKRPGEYARRSDFSPELLTSWIGHIMVLEYLPEQNDFRYRLFGTDIAQLRGFDMTGKLVSDSKSEEGDFLLGTYRDSVAKRAIVSSTHSGVNTVYACNWYRIVCPVQREQSVQIVACNYQQIQDT